MGGDTQAAARTREWLRVGRHQTRICKKKREKARNEGGRKGKKKRMGKERGKEKKKRLEL